MAVAEDDVDPALLMQVFARREARLADRRKEPGAVGPAVGAGR